MDPSSRRPQPPFSRRHLPPSESTARHRPGAFYPPTTNNGWQSLSLRGYERCVCGCSEMTSASILVFEASADGTLGKRIGPCHQSCVQKAVTKHGARDIAVVHARYGVPGVNAANAVSLSNALLYGRPEGPFAEFSSRR